MLLLLLSGLARPTPPPTELMRSETSCQAMSPEDELRDAVRKYQRQQIASAILNFHDLASNPDVPLEVRLEARIYLGEIRIIEGDQDKARDEFRRVIEADPYYQVDPFRHPPEVGVMFAEVRTEVIELLPPPVPPPVIMTPTLYYNRTEELTHEWPLTLLESGFAGCATGLNIYLLYMRTRFQDTPADRRRSRVLQGTQLGCFTGFVTTHVTRTFRARSHFQQEWRQSLRLGMGPQGAPVLMASFEIDF